MTNPMPDENLTEDQLKRLGQLALCAWNNVPPTNEFMASEWKRIYETSEHSRAGWKRVAEAIWSELRRSEKDTSHD